MSVFVNNLFVDARTTVVDRNIRSIFALLIVLTHPETRIQCRFTIFAHLTHWLHRQRWSSIDVPNGISMFAGRRPESENWLTSTSFCGAIRRVHCYSWSLLFHLGCRESRQSEVMCFKPPFYKGIRRHYSKYPPSY